MFHRLIPPSPEFFSPKNGVVSKEALLTAYANGFFPMAGRKKDAVEWFTADPRGIFDLEAFHIPRRVQRVVKSGKFEIRTDTAFEAVMRGCAEREESWISEILIRSYLLLRESGYAHSVESWRDGKLI